MPLREADTKETRRFEDGDDWLVLRVNLSKGQSDRLAELQSYYRLVNESGADGEVEQAVEIRARIAEINAALFGFLAESWSFSKTPTVDEYLALDEESGKWVDDRMGEIIAERRKRAEGNGSAPKPPAASRTSGRKARS